jgi:hypothetical protein
MAEIDVYEWMRITKKKNDLSWENDVDGSMVIVREQKLY